MRRLGLQHSIRSGTPTTETIWKETKMLQNANSGTSVAYLVQKGISETSLPRNGDMMCYWRRVEIYIWLKVILLPKAVVIHLRWCNACPDLEWWACYWKRITLVYCHNKFLDTHYFKPWWIALKALKMICNDDVFYTNQSSRHFLPTLILLCRICLVKAFYSSLKCPICSVGKGRGHCMKLYHGHSSVHMEILLVQCQMKLLSWTIIYIIASNIHVLAISGCWTRLSNWLLLKIWMHCWNPKIFFKNGNSH